VLHGVSKKVSKLDCRNNFKTIVGLEYLCRLRTGKCFNNAL